MSKVKAFNLSIICFFLLASLSWGQNVPGFIIESVRYNIVGQTRENILADKMDIEVGKLFSTKEELDRYVQDKQQFLISHRVLAEGKISYTLTPRADGAQGVHLKISTVDTWNLIILPYFRYDSNEGLLLSIRTRDFNFFGSMEPLRLDLDYLFSITDENEFGGSLEFMVPFQLLDRDFRAGLDTALTYNAADETFEIRTVVSLEMDISYLGRIWTLGLSQGYFYNPDDFHGDRSYLQTILEFGTEFETPFTLDRWTPVLYKPKVYAKANYWPNRELSEERRGYWVGFYHEIGVERIVWLENFRDGVSFAVGNDNYFNLRTNQWRRNLSGEAIGHKGFGWIGFSGRVKGVYEFDQELGIDPEDNPGAPIRGILDDRLRGDLIFYLNTDILFKMWTWFMDPLVEVKVGPFFDYAISKRRDRAIDWERDSWYGVGIQVLVYPRFARSLYLRGSLGWDLDAVLADGRLTGRAPRDGFGRHEIFIGLGHHY